MRNSELLLKKAFCYADLLTYIVMMQEALTPFLGSTAPPSNGGVDRNVVARSSILALIETGEMREEEELGWDVLHEGEGEMYRLHLGGKEAANFCWSGGED